MSSKIKGLPPRLAIRDIDNSPYRLGRNFRYFNDENTINFTPVSSSDYSVRNAPLFDLRVAKGYYVNTTGSLIAYWKFEPEDITGGRFFRNYTGTNFVLTSTISSHPPSPQTPNYSGSKGSSYSTANTTYLTTLHSSTFNFGNGTSDTPFSICAWLNLNDFDFRSNNRVIISKSGSSGREYSFHFDSGSQGLRLTLFDDSANASISRTVTNNFFYRDKWFHVAATYNSSSSGLRLYVNGKDAGGSLSSDGVYVAMEPLSQTVSIAGALGTNSLNGFIDEVAMFNRALNPYEVATIAGFKSGISMPLHMDASSQFLDPNLTTDIFISGSVIKGVFNQFYKYSLNEQQDPFTENNQPEQNKTSSFYLTGTDISIGNLNLTSPLKSKKTLKFNYYLGSTFNFTSTTASLAYFTQNEDTKLFTFVNTTSAHMTQPVNSHNMNFGNESKLFGPTGMKTMSGTHSSSNIPSPFHGETIQSSYAGATSYKQSSNALTLDSYLPSTFGKNNPLISLSNILEKNEQFLVEKAVITLSISASSNWLGDYTHAFIPTGTSEIIDVGGPCITFSILNFKNERVPRTLILSSTIIPSGDNKNTVETPLHSRQVPAGFLAYGGTPSAVVAQNTGSSFIGEVIMESTPGVSQGVYSYSFLSSTSFLQSSIISIDPIGRSMNVKNSENVFISDFNNLSIDDRQILSGSVSFIYNIHKFSDSPYLLNSSDNLIFCLSKYRSCVVNTSNRAILSSSHTVSVLSGSRFSVCLYGSLLSDNKEKNNIIKFNNESILIKDIGKDYVLDEYDIVPRELYLSGSSDRFITGTLISMNDRSVTTGSVASSNIRRVVGSSILKNMTGPPDTSDFTTSNPHRTSCAFQKFNQQICDDERFYDSMLPKIDKMFQTDGFSPFHNANSFYNVPTNIFWVHPTTTSSNIANYNWLRSFPFEPKYSLVERTVDPFRYTKSTRSIDNTPLTNGAIFTEKVGVYFGFARGTSIPRRIAHTIGGTDWRPSNSLVSKVLFGIGDGISGTVDLGNNVSSNYVLNAYARGTKYGLINFNPQYTKSIYRKDRYRGMVSDILQQRLFSKTRNDKKSELNSLQPLTIEFTKTDPEQMFRSNLSMEATSSLPFFDGEYKNRSTLISGSA